MARGLVLLAMAVTGAVPNPLPAQRFSVNATVQDASGTPVAGAVIRITPLGGDSTLHLRTDTAGSFVFVPRDSDTRYVVHISAPGHQDYRTTLSAPALQDLRIRLTRAPAELPAVTVRATRPRPPRSLDQGIAGAHGSGVNRGIDGLTGALSPDEQGDLASLATLLPGIQLGPDGLAALGLGAEQHLITLDGLPFADGALPGGVDVNARVVSAATDPSIGGAAGLMVQASIAPGGDLRYSSLELGLTGAAPGFDDRATRSLGRDHAALNSGLFTRGSTSNRWSYNAGIELRQRSATSSTLLGLDLPALQFLGVSADSLARFLSVVDRSGVPPGHAAGPIDRLDRTVRVAGRFDRRAPRSRTPGREAAWALTMTGMVGSETGVGVSVLALPTTLGRTDRRSASVQGTGSFYFGPGASLLNEVRSGFSLSGAWSDVATRAPSAQVRIASDLEDGSAAVRYLRLGGGTLTSAMSRSWSWHTINQTQLVAGQHRLMLHLESRLAGFARRPAMDRYGSWIFASLEDFEANRPSSFYRDLSTVDISGGSWDGALAVSNFWEPRMSRLQMHGGFRVEGNRFLESLRDNPDVQRLFGVRSDYAPSEIVVLPRLGFTWSTRGVGPISFWPMDISELGTLARGPHGLFRGGIAALRTIHSPSLLAGALAGGSSGGESTLYCVGDAAPVPDWPIHLRDPGSIPTECVGDSSSPLSDRAPRITLFDPAYRAPQTWRAHLGATVLVRRTMVDVNGIYSFNFNQTGWDDLNFAGSPIFFLSEENGRPVYVSESGISRETGRVSPVESRRSSSFSRVTSFRNDLRSRGGQISLALTPPVIARTRLRLDYTLAHGSTELRGFGADAFGNPRLREWAPMRALPTHALGAQVGRSIGDIAITTGVQLSSGIRYTPLVGTDINGDGLRNDRAFVFDPASVEDAQLAREMRELLLRSSEGARRCLTANLGRPASPMSCTGPWNARWNVRADYRRTIPGIERRIIATVDFVNPLAAIDVLLHGSRNARGWGAWGIADPVLLHVGGFDPSEQRFLYTVNPGFGDSRVLRRQIQQPFRITLRARIDLAQPLEIQRLRRSVTSEREGRRQPLPERVIRARLAAGVTDPYDVPLRFADSLGLDSVTREALISGSRRFRAESDSLLAGLASYLAQAASGSLGWEAVRRNDETMERAHELVRRHERDLGDLLSRDQQDLLRHYRRRPPPRDGPPQPPRSFQPAPPGR